ncbi:hypothetical protein A33M_3804 [Rhodovulum sp. PH10]|nr:hypothetical protein A33M_3804 [Rhodovulum sp. PH10]
MPARHLVGHVRRSAGSASPAGTFRDFRRIGNGQGAVNKSSRSAKPHATGICEGFVGMFVLRSRNTNRKRSVAGEDSVDERARRARFRGRD